MRPLVQPLDPVLQMPDAHMPKAHVGQSSQKLPSVVRVHEPGSIVVVMPQTPPPHV
jgi:hypothetical protein